MAGVGGVALINMRRPGRRNAFGRRMIAELAESVGKIQRDPTVRVVVLRSLVDGCFSAGADLKERAGMGEGEVTAFVDTLRDTFSMLEQVRVPTIAAIDGAALGGGLEVALCCDLRYGSAGASLGLPETRLAILPAAGGSQRLARLVGVSRAKQLIFTAAVIGADEAHRLGVLNEAVHSGLAIDRALHVARTISSNGTGRVSGSRA